MSSETTSSPVIFGISMSVMKTSGRCASTVPSASSPSRARPTTEMSPSISSRAASAPSTMPWSSAMTTRIVLRASLGVGDTVVEGSSWRRILDWQLDGEPRSSAGVALDPAAERLDAFAHAAQTVAFSRRAAAAVVLNFEAAMTIHSLELHPAVARLRVANHVGDGFPQNQREHTFMRGRQSDRHRANVCLHARRLQNGACVFDLFDQTFRAVAADGLAHVRQRLAGSLLHVVNFLLGLRHIAIDEFAGQF